MKYSKLISNLTNREKAKMLTGKDMWHLNDDLGQGFPSIMLTDGPHGLRKGTQSIREGVKTVKSTCFPTSSALACTWDKQLMREIGNALAEECIEEKVSVLLGPGINIKRNPLCGRNFEYYSEDPVVAGELSAQMINGVQELGIGTSLKHFAVNNTENRRLKCNSIIDERALREIYMRPFEIAVKKAMPWTVMCAYNKVNGIYCTENNYLIKDVLRNQWGFAGVTVSDWMAVDNRINALNAGLDIEMPSTGNANVNKIAKAIRKNTSSQEILDSSVCRVLDLIDKSEETLKQDHGYIYNRFEHHSLAQNAAQKSIVLLKNDDYVLPLKSEQNIAVIGNQAKEPVAQGYGSSRVNPNQVDIAYDSLLYVYPNLKFAQGYTKFANSPEPALIEEAKEVARSCDTAVVFVGASESDVCEGFDRVDMKLTNAQNELVDSVCAVCDNVVVVVTGGTWVEMPWNDKVKAVVQCYPLGEGGGVALANILVGNVSPSGKLPETFPVSFNDTPAKNFYGVDNYDNIQHREGIFVGYRYYEKVNKQVLYPFGHGLSYTYFDYKGIILNSNHINVDQSLNVAVEIQNAGYYEADEIIQLYIGKKDSNIARPVKELKAFEKVTLKPNESRIVKFVLDKTDFEYFSAKDSDWHVESGMYDIYVGSSSADIRLTSQVNVTSIDNIREVDDSQYTPNYFNADFDSMTNEEYENVLGFELVPFYLPKSEEITLDSTLSDIAGTAIGEKVISAISKTLHKLYYGDEVNEKMAYCMLVENIPLKRFSAISKGHITEPMIEGFIKLLNSNDKKAASKLILKGVVNGITSAIPIMLEKSRQKED